MKHKAIPLRITGCALTSGLMLYIFGRYSVELMGSYGYGLFLGLPFAGGFVSVLFFGEPLRNRLPVAACIGLYALAAGALFFLVTGFDGMICLQIQHISRRTTLHILEIQSCNNPILIKQSNHR